MLKFFVFVEICDCVYCFFGYVEDGKLWYVFVNFDWFLEIVVEVIVVMCVVYLDL